MSLWEYANPVKFIRTTDTVLPWVSWLALACLVVGLVWGFFFTPDDFRQGSTVKIIYLHVPSALMAINATRDAVQFSVGEAKKSIAGARRVFDLYKRSDSIRHVAIESGHAYNQPMREAMYGWMSKHLKGVGDGFRMPVYVVAASMLGFGSLAHDSGLSFGVSVVSTATVWGLPGQVAWRRRRDMLLALIEPRGFVCSTPRGAYYVMTDIGGFGFADDVEFSRYLVEEVGVAVVPGSSFYHDPALGPGFAGSPDNGLHLGGVVAVVVHQREAAARGQGHVAIALEAPPHALEIGQRLDDRVVCHPHLGRHGDGGGHGLRRRDRSAPDAPGGIRCSRGLPLG